LIRALLAAIVVLVLFSPIWWPLVHIQLRLWRNGAIATRLVESLRGRFPGADFRGIASYEKEIIYISVLGGLRPESRPDVEQWLRALKAEQNIAPAIMLRFPDTPVGEDAIEI
jgi:hypothetical protein